MPNIPSQWTDLPTDIQNEFLMYGKIQLDNWYIDEVNVQSKKSYGQSDVNNYLNRIKNKEMGDSYGYTDIWLYEALECCPIMNKTVAVMGSINPWYESVVLGYGGLPTTVEYNLPNYNCPQIKEILFEDLKNSNMKFNVGLSISSFEHDGLGRYGDPINPNGDLDAMQTMKKIIDPNGILFLAVPIGKDKVVWNAHRVYGTVRLNALLTGWKVLGTVGLDEDCLSQDRGNDGSYQPIFVLENI